MNNNTAFPILFGFIVVFLISLFLFYVDFSKQEKHKVVEDKNITQQDTIIISSIKKYVRPRPYNTKFKITDIVCAWGKWTGVVNEIDWSSKDTTIVKYGLQIYKGEEQGWVDEWYFDTELELGKCY